MNDPSKGFKFGPVFAPSNQDAIRELTVGDFNGDGQPEIAELYVTADAMLHLAIFTVDPETLAISQKTQADVAQQVNLLSNPLQMAAGRFTAATHQQLIIGYILYVGGNDPAS